MVIENGADEVGGVVGRFWAARLRVLGRIVSKWWLDVWQMGGAVLVR